MKKLNNKQKLMGSIAIIIIAVIIAIIITVNFARNRKIASEEYLATTANADSSLIANYILSGITIGGITGKMEVLNTYDATARPEDITEGKTAYVKREKIVGTYKEAEEVISDDTLEINENTIYYADFDSTGEITVDGVIFVDLSQPEKFDQWGVRS